MGELAGISPPSEDCGAWGIPSTPVGSATPSSDGSTVSAGTGNGADSFVTGISVFTNVDTGVTTIGWDADAQAIGYTIRVKNLTTGDDNIVLENITSPQWVSAEPLPIGRMRTWVKPLYPSEMSGEWSNGRNFRIRTRPSWTAPAGRTLDPTPTLDWIALSGAASYEIRANSTTDGVTESILESNLTTTLWTPESELPIGQHHWQVRAFDVGGLPTLWSRSLRIAVSVAPVPAQASFETLNRTPQFDWSPVAGADRYRLWVNNQSTGEQKVIDLNDITDTSFTPAEALVHGEYEWWVRAINDGAAGSFAANWSQRATMHIGAAPQLLTPSIIQQEDKLIIGWNSIDGAANYDIWIDDITIGIPQVFRQTTSNRELDLTAMLARGKNYRVWIRAIAADGTFGLWNQGQVIDVL